MARMRAIEAAVEVLKREGIDMITGLYSAAAGSIPILCITGQAPRARLHKQDFQAVDIASITQPVTKWATTVLEPAQVPRVFQKAFHIMRSGRPAGENGVTENG